MERRQIAYLTVFWRRQVLDRARQVAELRAWESLGSRKERFERAAEQLKAMLKEADGRFVSYRWYGIAREVYTVLRTMKSRMRRTRTTSYYEWWVEGRWLPISSDADTVITRGHCMEVANNRSITLGEWEKEHKANVPVEYQITHIGQCFLAMPSQLEKYVYQVLHPQETIEKELWGFGK